MSEISREQDLMGVDTADRRSAALFRGIRVDRLNVVYARVVAASRDSSGVERLTVDQEARVQFPFPVPGPVRCQDPVGHRALRKHESVERSPT
jgi:hypothetical protein